MKLEIGNSVVVKKGIVDLDSEKFLLEGWQGRIIKIDKEKDSFQLIEDYKTCFANR